MITSFLFAVALCGPAGAWDLAPARAFDLPGATNSLAMGAHGLLLLGEDALWMVDPATGGVIDNVEPGGRSLLLVDMNGDGNPDAVFCRDDGLVYVATNLNFGGTAQVTHEACDVVVLTDFGGAGGFATAGGPVRLWDQRGADAGASGMVLDGPPLLAAHPDGLAASWEGASSVRSLGALGVDLLAAGGRVAGLGTLSDRFTWTLSDAWLLADEDAVVVALPAEPGAFLTGELDGDTATDTLVLHPGSGTVSLVRGLDGEVVTAALGIDSAAALLHDDDGDGCADLWAVDGDRLVIYRVDGCGGHLDQDGDGSPPDGGDCDDGDPAVHPGALETCDGRDQDCDGDVDELMVAVIPVVMDTGADPRADSDGDSMSLLGLGWVFLRRRRRSPPT